MLFRSRGIDAVPTFDTAGAVAAVVSGGDPSSAAIASRRAAELHGGDILAECIQDYPDNWTRFLHLVPGAPAHVGQKAIASFRLRHEPGSLSRALAEFLLNIEAVQQLVVLKTGAGQAQLMAVAIDKARLPDVAGTLAGDDTILIIARDAKGAQQVVKHLKDLAQ